MILCAYYFDRQASHRQVKASAQSSLDVQLGQQQCNPELSELVSVVGSAHSSSTGSNGPHTTVAGTTAALAVPVHLVQEPHRLHQGRDCGSYPPSVRPSPPSMLSPNDAISGKPPVLWVTPRKSVPRHSQRTDAHGKHTSSTPQAEPILIMTTARGTVHEQEARAINERVES